MDVTRELDALRQNVAGCSLAAFADIGSQMILTSSSASRAQQEDLDALSAAAHALLGGAIANEASKLVSSNESGVETAVLISSEETRLFLRSTDRPSEALVLVVAPGSDLVVALNAGRDCLNKVVDADVDPVGDAS